MRRSLASCSLEIGEIGTQARWRDANIFDDSAGVRCAMRCGYTLRGEKVTRRIDATPRKLLGFDSGLLARDQLLDVS